MGIRTDRMKTGTPVRIDARSVHFEEMTEQPGEDDFHKFSFLDTEHRLLRQLSCWTTYTNEACHAILREGLPDSPLYNGQIQSIGPRYCPSIETKIVTFAERNQHQLFLEPEGESTQEYYLNGFSSSLPFEIQLRALQAIPAFRHSSIITWRQKPSAISFLPDKSMARPVMKRPGDKAWSPVSMRISIATAGHRLC